MLWLEGSEKLLPVLLTLKNQRDRKAGRRITLAAEEGHWIHRVNTSVVCVPPKSFTHLYTLPCLAPKPKDPDSDFCSYTLLKIKQTLNQPHKHPEDILGQQAFGTFWMTMTLPHFPHHQLFPLESAGEQIPPGRPTFLLLGLGNTVCKESENNHIMIKHFTLPTGYYKLHNQKKKKKSNSEHQYHSFLVPDSQLVYLVSPIVCHGWPKTIRNSRNCSQA